MNEEMHPVKHRLRVGFNLMGDKCAATLLTYNHPAAFQELQRPIHCRATDPEQFGSFGRGEESIARTKTL
jgi:hypothetical protein